MIKAIRGRGEPLTPELAGGAPCQHSIEKMFRVCLHFVEKLSVGVANLALTLMMFIVTGSVIGRTLFNFPIPDDLLLVGLLMVLVIAFPLAHIQRVNGHIAVTIISDRLPFRLRQLQIIVGNVLFALFLGVMGFVILSKVPKEFAQDLYYDGQLEIRTWPMKAMFALGIGLFVLQVVISICKDCAALFLGAAQPDQSSDVDE